MNYVETVEYLYSLQKHGIKLGLENTVRLLALLGNPQNSFRSVHVAGTNGKGSTSAMIASVLKAAGFRVGLFTSPHMVSFTERIRVGDAEITEREVVDLTREIREVVEKNQLPVSHEPFLPTFFEFVTALGFLYFKRKEVHWAVIETGMGGRLDATNVLVPRVTVITNISLDHGEFLGETLGEIAGEKAGIIKDGIPVVSSAQEAEAMEIIASTASEKKSNLFVYGKDFISYPKRVDMRGVTFDYRGRENLKDLYVPLSGIYQVENASLAAKAIELVMEIEPIAYEVIRGGFSHTLWQGRLELIRNEGGGCDFLIDGAHNPAASKALADALKYFLPGYGKMVLILGVMADKDVEGIMKPLLPLASETIFTSPGYERAASPGLLSEYAWKIGFRSRIVLSVKEAVDLAKETAGRGEGTKTLVVITGSFYTIGEAKAHLGAECSCPSLSRLR